MEAMTLQQLLSMGGQAETPEMTDDQIAKTLRNVMAARLEHHVLVPGMIVRHKFPSVAPVIEADKPSILVKMLKDPIEGRHLLNEPGQLGQNASTMIVDCIVGIIHRGHYHEHYSNSRDWEPHPDFRNMDN